MELHACGKCLRVLRVHSKASSPKFINKLLNIIFSSYELIGTVI